MAGISNICHLPYDSRQCDSVIKSFGRQTSREISDERYEFSFLARHCDNQILVAVGVLHHVAGPCDIL